MPCCLKMNNTMELKKWMTEKSMMYVVLEFLLLCTKMYMLLKHHWLVCLVGKMSDAIWLNLFLLEVEWKYCHENTFCLVLNFVWSCMILCVGFKIVCYHCYIMFWMSCWLKLACLWERKWRSSVAWLHECVKYMFMKYCCGFVVTILKIKEMLMVMVKREYIILLLLEEKKEKRYCYYYIVICYYNAWIFSKKMINKKKEVLLFINVRKMKKERNVAVGFCVCWKRRGVVTCMLLCC